MIDMHSHIIFNVDDGSVDLCESMEMIRNARDVGFTDIVATPHYINNTEFNSLASINAEILNILKEEIINEQLRIHLFLGNEAFLDMDLVDDLKNKKVATLNNTSYVLLEIPRHRVIFENLLSFIFELQVNGYYVILAHPERYDFVIEDPQKISQLIERDVLIQLNLLSIVGTYGKEIKDTAMLMLEHNMVHFIGSDAHKAKSYKMAGNSLEILRNEVSKDKFIEITELNPRYVLSNQMLYPDAPLEIKRKGLFSRLKKRR